MDEGDRHAALADGRRNALHRGEPDVAAREDAGHARLEQVRVAIELPPSRRLRRAGEDEAVGVEGDLGREPAGLGVGADEDGQPPDSSRVTSPVSRLRTSIASRDSSPWAATTSAPETTPTFGSAELVDEVSRHAASEPAAATEDRHAPGVAREEHGRLPGRVARTHDVDVQSVGVRGLAPRGAVEDALARQALEAIDGQPSPGDAAGEDDRPAAQDVAVVEMDAVRRSLDPRDRPGHENLGAEPPRLLEGTRRGLLAGDARREPG